MAVSMHQYQPTWHNFRDGVQNAMKLREQKRQHDVAQALKQEEFEADKANWNKTFDENQKRWEAGWDITKESHQMDKERHNLEQRANKQAYEKNQFDFQWRKDNRGAQNDLNKWVAEIGKAHSEYKTLKDQQPWYYTGETNMRTGIRLTADEVARRDAGLTDLKQSPPTSWTGIGAGGLEMAQTYFPSVFGADEEQAILETNAGLGYNPVIQAGQNSGVAGSTNSYNPLNQIWNPENTAYENTMNLITPFSKTY